MRVPLTVAGGLRVKHRLRIPTTAETVQFNRTPGAVSSFIGISDPNCTNCQYMPGGLTGGFPSSPFTQNAQIQFRGVQRQLPRLRDSCELDGYLYSTEFDFRAARDQHWCLVDLPPVDVGAVPAVPVADQE